MPQTLKQHQMSYTSGVAQTASAEITHFLLSHWPQHSVAVHNVEEDPAYQTLDVDLLWSVLEHGRLRLIPIEVKGDRYHRTGNFFFETVSNEGKGTAGCFLYTKAEWLFYYFVESGDLYCMPMEKVRPWFEANQQQFEEKRTSTPVGNDSYVTVGRLVPIARLMAENLGVYHYTKTEESWRTNPNE